MSLGNNVDPHQAGMPDMSVFWQPDTAMITQTKTQLGIIADTLGSFVIPFTQIQQPYKNYKASPDQPILDLSLVSQRGLLANLSGQAQDNSDSFKQLISYLPDDIKQSLLESLSEPVADRDPNMVALNSVLQGAATVLTTLAQVSQPLNPESPAAKGAEAFGTFAERTASNLINLSNTLLTSLQSSLNELGPNDPNFDSLNNILNQSQQAISDFNNLKNAMNQIPPPDKLTDLKNKVAGDMSRLNTLYNSKNIGDSLQLLKPILSLLTLVTSSLTLENANPALMLSATFGNVGINTSKTASGTIGPGIETMNTGIANGLINLFLPQGSPGDKNMLPSLLNLTTILFLGMGSLAAKADYGEAADNDPNVGKFAFELGLTLLSNSGVLPQVFGVLAGSSGITEKDQSAASAALTAATLIGLAYTGAQGNQNKLESLISIISAPLSASISTIEDQVNNSLSGGSLRADTASEVNVDLTHARLALQNEDMSGFISALSNALGAIGTKDSNLKNDLKLIGNAAELFSDAANGAVNSQTNTLTGIQRLA